MMLFLLCLLAVVAHVAGQSALQQLEHEPELSKLFDFVNASSTLTSLLESANDFTFLAPSDAAFDRLIESRNGAELSDDDVDVLLQYHLLNGMFPTDAWSDKPQFLTTSLKDPEFTNVTGGQVVEVRSDGQGSTNIFSWNKTVSAITTPNIECTGGLIQIISTALAIPQEMGVLLLQHNFRYFFAGLWEVGITSTASFNPVADEVNSTDVTFFIPNTPQALNKFTDITSRLPNSSEVLEVLRYHIVPNNLLYSTMFRDGMVLQTSTMGGSNLSITKLNGDTYVNQAKIIHTDYLVSNGVVHVIDDLLSDLPPSTNSGLSTGVKIAIGIVLGIGIPVIAVCAFLWFRRARARAAERAAILPSGQKKRPYVPSFDGPGSKVNRVLGQDLELDPPLLNSNKYLKASAAELDATPLQSRDPSERTLRQSLRDKNG